MDKDDKGWEEAVSHILEAGKASIDSRAAMRQLGEMVGSYYLGLVDAGLAPEQAALAAMNICMHLLGYTRRD